MLTVVTLLVLDHPTVACACNRIDGDVLEGENGGQKTLDTVTQVCLLRLLLIEKTQWLNALARSQNDRRGICFATMDRANARFHTAFDKAHNRL